MDAPLYPPSQGYERPITISYPMTSANTAIATLLADPDIKAIILREIPDFEGRIGNVQLKPHLGNFSPRSMVQFGLFKPEALDRVDTQLAALSQARGGAR